MQEYEENCKENDDASAVMEKISDQTFEGEILETLNSYGRRRHVMCGFWPSVSMRFFGGVGFCKRSVLEVLMRFDKNPFRSYVSSQLIITESCLGGPGICGKTRLVHSDLDIMLRCKMRGGGGSFKRFRLGVFGLFDRW